MSYPASEIALPESPSKTLAIAVSTDLVSVSAAASFGSAPVTKNPDILSSDVKIPRKRGRPLGWRKIKSAKMDQTGESKVAKLRKRNFESRQENEIHSRKK